MANGDNTIRLFLCGDIMTGRGIDQVLPHSGDPRLHEPYMDSAEGYVALAEQANGRVPRPAGFDYIWGDALSELQQQAPDIRLVNLETAITVGGDYWRGKGIHYRMHPDNIDCLTVAHIDACSLANNHVLDWGYEGLGETLGTLRRAGIEPAGAGHNDEEAARPVCLPVAGRGRVLFYAFATGSSGVPPEWAAGPERPGVNLLFELSDATIASIADAVARTRRRGDIVIVSLHWGGNWGYQIPDRHRRFARGLIERAGVDIVHGHSSHHPLGIEVYRDRLILYGCGDLLNDYEGIGGYERFRADLGLMYFPAIDPADGRLRGLTLTPMQVRRLRLNRTAPGDQRWLESMLNREGRRLGTSVERGRDGRLRLAWS